MHIARYSLFPPAFLAMLAEHPRQKHLYLDLDFQPTYQTKTSDWLEM